MIFRDMPPLPEKRPAAQEEPPPARCGETGDLFVEKKEQMNLASPFGC